MERAGHTSELSRRTLWEWLADIEGPNREAVERLLSHDDNRRRLETSPGSRAAHHNWAGGWMEHERQTMMIVAHTYELFALTGRMAELPEAEQFTLSDALTVMFLHDIEKPFVYGFDEAGEIVTEHPMTKQERKEFRRQVIGEFGFTITPTMANALTYVEGERDVDYVPGERAEQPLASLCQVADNLSARAFYDHGG